MTENKDEAPKPPIESADEGFILVRRKKDYVNGGLETVKMCVYKGIHSGYWRVSRLNEDGEIDLNRDYKEQFASWREAFNFAIVEARMLRQCAIGPPEWIWAISKP